MRRGLGGRRDDLGGRYFRSRYEANFARYLGWLESIGEILEWAYEADTWEFPIKRGNKFYKSDFRVKEKDGRVRFYEIKGYMDADSTVKLKRMKKYYPDVDLTVIGPEEYRNLARDVKNLVPGWEVG